MTAVEVSTRKPRASSIVLENPTPTRAPESTRLAKIMYHRLCQPRIGTVSLTAPTNALHDHGRKAIATLF